MKLIVQELETYLEQEMVVGDANINVIAVRPHILKYASPAGALYVQIYDSTGVTLIATSETINISDVSTSPYFHGYIRFYINAFLQKGTTYRFRLTGISGYLFSESNYIGWCNGFDLEKYKMNPVPADALLNPLDLEIWHKREA